MREKTTRGIADRKGEFLWYLGGTLLSLLFLGFALRLWEYDLRVPFWYSDGDNMQTVLFAKRVKDGFFVNEYLGAPFYSLQIDFPLYGDAVNLFFEGILMALTKSVGMTINVFYLMLFPLTYCTSFYVMRKCGISRLFALCGALLYAFLPYRCLRRTMHLFLSNYAFVPFSVWLCIEIYTREEQKITRDDIHYLVAVVPLVALCGIYYAFFSCFFFVLSILLRYLKDRKISLFGAGLVAETVAWIGLATIPSIFLLHTYGQNPEAPVRSAIEAEIYGLKITQFFIPNSSHGISFLDNLHTAYKDAPLPNEGSEYLGIAGAIGLLCLFVYLFVHNEKNENGTYLKVISELNIGAVLLSTIGGFGSLFALLISPQIRGYNRISVFVAFLSLVAIGLIVTGVCDKGRHRRLISVVVVIVATLSLFEQATFDKSALRQGVSDYYSDNCFIQRIEEYASDGAMIYQYPYFPFPETPPKNKMGDYALARGYAHSESLRWSYGDYKGRTSDLWNRHLSSMPLDAQIKILGLLGFEGIYIDQYAYTAQELSALKTTIESEIGDSVCFSSENGRLFFYGLRDYLQSLDGLYSPEKLAAEQKLAVYAPFYTNGFFPQEGNGDYQWRWGNQSGSIVFYNPTEAVVHASFSAIAYSGYTEESSFTIQNGDEQWNYKISADGIPININFEISPGKQELLMQTDAMRVEAPGDSRELYFRLSNPEIVINED